MYMIKNYPNKFIPANYQQCTMTLMDNIADPNIRFDSKGICNYYHEYFSEMPEEVKDKTFAKSQLEKIVNKILMQKGNYNCILGVSGGVDSTYLALKAKELGLKPLLVHFDNGWNSELSVKNIENIVNNLGFDLYTHVFNWEQFRDIQLAHFRANVIDIEAITDVAIAGTLTYIAQKYKIKFVLSGNNYVTEKILPKAWIFKDYFNIIDIHNKYGS
ncbi:MAG: N-acetyl sugar amidotransferase, partial [Candidatus Calescibacterium sp.]|nr:N-acetyl sugar amidotransferase [Candidatus Calescibacterium sp.]